MGKRKAKKRKQKLARPPKRRTEPRSQDRSDAGCSPFETGGDDYLEAPPAPARLRGSERPFGSVDPSLYASARYQNFKKSVAALRSTLPASQNEFATYDLPRAKDRQWLTRYCIKKEAGDLPGWQQAMLETAGFNWRRGRPPRSKPSKRPVPATDSSEAIGPETCQALAAACREQAFPLLGVLLCENAQYAWLRAQAKAMRSGELEASLQKQLRALPVDLDNLLDDPGFGKWRKSFRAYATGELPDAERWARHQAKLKHEGKLLRWRVEALDALGFDWTIGSPQGINAQAAMEARWRSHLKAYCQLKTDHGGSGPPPLHADKSLRPWVSRMRSLYKKGQLRAELIQEFEACGFEFDGKAPMLAAWNQSFEKLRAFKQRFGHVRVPSSYSEDIELGKWVANQQERMRKGTLDPEKRNQLEALGLAPRNKVNGRKSKKVHISPWLRMLGDLETILEAEHGGRLPKVGRLPVRLREWLRRQAKYLEADRLEPWQVEHLKRIGFETKS